MTLTQWENIVELAKAGQSASHEAQQCALHNLQEMARRQRTLEVQIAENIVKLLDLYNKPASKKGQASGPSPR